MIEKCPKESELFDLVLSECSKDKKTDLLSHIDSCQSCGEAYIKLVDLHEGMNEIKEVEKENETKDFSKLNQHISNYEVISLIGEGGMGEVYKALDKKLNRKVAIKMMKHEIKEDVKFQNRFSTEAECIAQLNHPNIVQIYHSDAIDDENYIVMEYIDGVQLNYFPFKESNSQTEELRVFLQIAEGLHYAHQNKIVHRDIKSSNIMIDKNGRIKILDFGLARSEMEGVLKTCTNSILGSVAYMAPEIVKGERASVQSDIYSLGIVFYEIITKTLPFHADTPLGALDKIKTEAMPQPSSINKNVNPKLNALILEMCAKDPAQRQNNCQSIIESIQAIISEQNNNSSGDRAPVIEDSSLTKTRLFKEVAEEMDLPPDEVEKVLFQSNKSRGKKNNHKKLLLCFISVIAIAFTLTMLKKGEPKIDEKKEKSIVTSEVKEVEHEVNREVVQPEQTGLSANIEVIGDNFTIKPLKHKSRAYSNRTYVWKKIPHKYRGWMYTHIATDDKKTIKIFALSSGCVYVAINEKTLHLYVNDNKGWVRDCDIPLAIPHHNRPTFYIFKKIVKKGETIVLPTYSYHGSLALFKASALKRVLEYKKD